MNEPRETAQWTCDVTVFHVDGFKKRIRAGTLGRHGGWVTVGTWEWSGLGIPPELIPDISGRITAVIEEHLCTRYGIEGELPFRWAGEAAPD